MAIYQRLDNFSHQPKKAKIGGNIKANTSVEIPANYLLKFKPLKEFMVAMKSLEVK